MIKKITNISDQGIICDFGEEVNKDINKKVISLLTILKKRVIMVRLKAFTILFHPITN